MKKNVLVILILLLTVLAKGHAYDLTVGTTEHGTLAFQVGGQSTETAEAGQVVKVVVTPAEGYSTKEVTALAYTGWENAQSRPLRSSDSGTGIDLLAVVPEGSGDEWTFTMPEANVKVSATYKRVIQDSWIQDIAAMTYTGGELKPKVTVIDGKTTLVEGTDYVVTYTDNVEACPSTAATHAPTVTVTALPTSEGFSGEGSKTFTINMAQTAITVTPVGRTDLAYTTEDQLLIKTAGESNFGKVVYSLEKDGPFGEAADIKAKNAGDYTIYYKVEGTSNFHGMEALQVQATIHTVPLSVTAEDQTVTYGDEAPAYTVVYDGFVGGETPEVLGGTLDYDCAYQKGSDVGEYVIMPLGLTSGNYELSFIPGQLTVDKAAAIVTEPTAAVGLVYAGEDQALVDSGAVTGGTLLYSLDGETYDEAVPTGKDAGDYTVYYKVVADDNHHSSSEGFFGLSIALAPLTVTAADQVITYGDDVPEYTAVYDGLVGGETAEVLAGTLTFACDYEKGSDVGDYTIAVEGLSSDNYELTFGTGTLTVDKAGVSMTAPTVVTGLIYTGGEQVIATAGSTGEGGVMMYSLDGENYAETVPTGKNAGQYTIYYKVVADGNHRDVDAQTVSTSIAQGVGDIEMLNKEVTMPYNAGSFTVKPMVLLGDGPLRYASSNDSVAQVIYYTGEIFINSIGKTTITINMGSTPNATADTTSFVLTVTPASATLVNITRLSMGYGMPNFKVSSIRETLTEGKDYTLSYKDTEGKAVTEADMLAKPGRYVVVANLKGNYEGTQELEFTVSADPTATGIDAVTGDDDGTVRYDMNGRRVESSRRGLIIENGKKRYVRR